MPRDNLRIPLTESEAVALLGRVKPTADMPRQGAHSMKAKPTKRQAEPKERKTGVRPKGGRGTSRQ